MFQALLRNPLASPDTLGVSAGASLGAMIAITFNLDFSLLGVSAVPLASFAGSLGALAIVYGLSAARRRGTSTMVLLLGGVTLQALLSAVIAFVQYLADFTETFRNVRWLMGSLDVGLVRADRRRARADGDRVGRLRDAAARARSDQRRRRSRPRRAASTSSAPSGSRSSARRWRPARRCRSAGPVSFVGIIVPHLVRLIVGADHRLVLPASALFGARVPDRLRSRRAHDHRAARTAGRHHHRHHRRAGVFMAAVSPRLTIAIACRPGGVLARRWRRQIRRPRASAGDPRRIISLVPATTEMLFAMGARRSRRRRQQLRPLSAGSRALPARRRAARPERRADALAEARPGDRLRHADRPEAAARTRADPDVRLRRTAGWPTSPRRCARSASAIGASGGGRGRGARASSSSSRRSRARVAGRAAAEDAAGLRPRPGTLRHIDASGGYGFLHDLLELAGGADVLGRPAAAVGRDEHGDDLARAPEVIIELHYGESLKPERVDAERRVWNALPSVPAVKNNRVYLLDRRRVRRARAADRHRRRAVRAHAAS